MKTNGYKTNKTGFEFGTRFEYYQDLNLGLSSDHSMKKLAPIKLPLLDSNLKKAITGILL